MCMCYASKLLLKNLKKKKLPESTGKIREETRQLLVNNQLMTNKGN